MGKCSNHSDEDFQRLEESGWRCFYLFSLLPLSDRFQYTGPKLSLEIADHFERVEAEHLDAKKRLVEGTLRYVLTIARLYIDSGVPYLDLVQEGFFGLIRATETYNEHLGAHFQHYAGNWIRQRITRFLADYSRLIRIPVHMHEYVTQVHRKYEDLAEKLGYQPSVTELALSEKWLTHKDIHLLKEEKRRVHLAKQIANRYLEVYPYLENSELEPPKHAHEEIHLLREKQQELKKSLKRKPSSLELFTAADLVEQADAKFLFDCNQIRHTLQLNDAKERLKKLHKRMSAYYIANATHYPLDQIVTCSTCRTSNHRLGDYLPAVESIVQAVEITLLRDVLQDCLSQLNERERDVIIWHFGLLDEGPKTLEEIGQLLGLTRERIRQSKLKP